MTLKLLLLFIVHIIHFYKSVNSSPIVKEFNFNKNLKHEDCNSAANFILTMAPPPITRLHKITQQIEQMPNLMQNLQNTAELKQNCSEMQEIAEILINDIGNLQNPNSKNCEELKEIIQKGSHPQISNNELGSQNEASTSSKWIKTFQADSDSDHIYDSDYEMDDFDKSDPDYQCSHSDSDLLDDVIKNSDLDEMVDDSASGGYNPNQNLVDQNSSSSISTGRKGKTEQQREQKRRMIEKYKEIKQNNPKLSDRKIAEKLGINRGQMHYLKKCEGLVRKNKYEKREFAKIYNEIKEQNPGIMEKDVAKMLNISPQCLAERKMRKDNYKHIRKYERMDLQKTNEFAKIYNEIKEQNPGIKDKDVAKIFNISIYCLSKRKIKIGQQRPRNRTTREYRSYVARRSNELKLNNSNLKHYEIANLFGISSSMLSRWEKEFSGINREENGPSSTNNKMDGEN